MRPSSVLGANQLRLRSGVSVMVVSGDSVQAEGAAAPAARPPVIVYALTSGRERH